MKVALLVTIVSAIGVSARFMTHPGAKEKCGRLGPMWFDPDQLPDGATPQDVRMCSEHPMGMANWWGFGEYLPHWFPGPPFQNGWSTPWYNNDPNEEEQQPETYDG